MRYVVVSVFDQAVAAYARPVFVRSEGEAVRSFSDEVNRPAEDNPLYKHPEHYSLHMLGFFHDDVGKFEGASPAPLLLAQGQQVKI